MCCRNGGYVSVAEMGGMCCRNVGYVSVGEMGGICCRNGGMYPFQKWGHVSVAEMGGMCCGNGGYVSVAEMVWLQGQSSVLVVYQTLDDLHDLTVPQGLYSSDYLIPS